MRQAGVFEPYHARIRTLLDARQAAQRRTVYVAMHSFTPVFKGESRAMQVGVLYNRDAQLANVMLDLLRAEGDLVVGDNAPYAVSDVTDYGVPVHAERRGLRHVEIEIRQDLIADAAGQAAWAARFDRLLRIALKEAAMLSREVPIDAAHAALLFVDVQNYNARPDGGDIPSMSATERDDRYGYFFRVMRETALPNMQRLQAACRHARIEVMYTVIEALTHDGRDLSLDYKISGLFVARGSWDAKVLDAIAPTDDEIVLGKTSSSVFISTNVDYVLRNLGVRSLIIAGVLTDQCIDSAVRDACDLGIW